MLYIPSCKYAIANNTQFMNNLKVSRRLSTIKYSRSSSSISWLSGERTNLSRIVSVPRYRELTFPQVRSLPLNPLDAELTFWRRNYFFNFSTPVYKI